MNPLFMTIWAYAKLNLPNGTHSKTTQHLKSDVRLFIFNNLGIGGRKFMKFDTDIIP
jgi:hypothetical protein